MQFAHETDKDDEETMLRKSLAKLDVQRKSMEHEADAIFLELTTPPEEGVDPMGIDTPLVDLDGYPRGDIDVYRARTLRARFRVLQTDHREISNKIHDMLIQLAALKNPNKKLEEEKEQAARAALKPKPKYDAKTGKWVAMNWDGTVAGIPHGDKMKFHDNEDSNNPPPTTLEHQLSGLTEDASLNSSSRANSTHSIQQQLEPHPPTKVLNEQAKIPFARIDTVAAGSPAYLAGLEEEDLILQFGPIDSENHDHLKALTEYIPEQASEQRSITIQVLRRRVVTLEEQQQEQEQQQDSKKDEWETCTIMLKPRPWSGRGLAGCHIVPYTPPK